MHVLRVKYRQKYLLDNKSRFLYSCFDLGWKASDKAQYDKGLYKDDTICMASFNVICYRFSIKCKQMWRYPNGSHQRGWLGHMLRGRLGQRCLIYYFYFPHYIIPFTTLLSMSIVNLIIILLFVTA